MSFNRKLPTTEPDRDYFDLFNNEFPYLKSINNNVTLSTINESDFIRKNMTSAFLSEDEKNCPCASYDIEKIIDSEYNYTLSVKDAYGYQFSIDNQGIF